MQCTVTIRPKILDGYFTDKFLEPLLLAKIDDAKEEIIVYDKKLVSSLDSRNASGPMKGVSVKKLRNSVEQNLFTCRTCHQTFKNFSSLTKHKVEHSVNPNHSSVSLLQIVNSTRNNSLAHDALLCEDVTLEDHALVTCDEAPENVVVENKYHNKVKEIFKCNVCTYTTTD